MGRGTRQQIGACVMKYHHKIGDIHSNQDKPVWAVYREENGTLLIYGERLDGSADSHYQNIEALRRRLPEGYSFVPLKVIHA